MERARGTRRHGTSCRAIDMAPMLCLRAWWMAAAGASCRNGMGAHVTTRCASSFKIYTRTGDKGTSSLFNGERRPKDDDVFEALGATDELNSFIGLAREHCITEDNQLDDKLLQIQCMLQDIGSHVATPRTDASQSKIVQTQFDDQNVSELESWIDKLDETLPPLTNFILPGGGLAACHLHVARTAARRAERRVVPLVAMGGVGGACGRYLNRLSDFLFTAGRYAAHNNDRKDAFYRKVSTTRSSQ